MKTTAMAFIDLTEAFPKKDGIYKVMVNSVNKKGYEAKAKWIKEKGFQLMEGTLDDDSFITRWWSEDNIR